MGRYREPSPSSTAIITPEGYRVLRDELHELKHRVRPEIVKALSAAAAEGDRSENAEYIYRKKQLRELDRRVGYLIKRFDRLKVVTTVPSDTQKIYFGAWVEIESGDGHRCIYRIVGPDEFDLAKGCVSIDSPLARGLLSKSVDDEVVIHTPSGSQWWSVLRVWYDQAAESE